MDITHMFGTSWGKVDVDHWNPIETAPLPEFNNEKWYDIRFRCLVKYGKVVEIATYSYTEKGKGRWRNSFRVIEPEYWMPLPR